MQFGGLTAPMEGLPRHAATADKTRIGWFTTWNCKCGIAEYSRQLLEHFDDTRFELTILASHNDGLLEPDPPNVIRCWGNGGGSLQPLLKAVANGRFEVFVIQYKIQSGFSWLPLTHLEALLAFCHLSGTRVFLVAHATDGAVSTEGIVSKRMKSALATIERVLVHSTEDLQRLHNFGLDSNVGLLPHGYPECSNLDRKTMRATLGFSDDELIIGSYGFLLPLKGIDKLIEALGTTAFGWCVSQTLTSERFIPPPYIAGILRIM